MTQFPPSDRLGQRVLPIPKERLRLDIQKQPAGQAESQHQEFQRLDSQQGQRLGQVRHFAAESEERTIDHAKDSAGDRRVVLNTLFEGPRIYVGVPRQLQNLHGDAGQTVELSEPCRQVVQGRRGIDHGGVLRFKPEVAWAAGFGRWQPVNLAYRRSTKSMPSGDSNFLAGSTNCVFRL